MRYFIHVFARFSNNDNNNRNNKVLSSTDCDIRVLPNCKYASNKLLIIDLKSIEIMSKLNNVEDIYIYTYIEITFL